MNKFYINKNNNFMRIFRLPKDMPSGYCFGGGHPVNFQLVDWFNPVCEEELLVSGILEGAELDVLRKAIKEFIRPKIYFDCYSTYLAITDYGDAFLINNERKKDG